MAASLALLEAYSLLSTSSPPSTASPLEPRDHARTGLQSSVLLWRHSSSMAVSESEASRRAPSPLVT